MEVVSITSAAQAGLTSEFSDHQCLMFSALFVSCMSLLLSPSEDVVLPSTNRIVLFLNPSRLLCVHVDVEMTSVVELFSGRFGFSVKSGM